MIRRTCLGLAALLAVSAATPLRAGLTCTPGPYVVFFAWQSSAIHREAVATLDNAIESSGDCGSMTVLLAGHSDTSEAPSISRDRIRAVSNYLASRGIFVKRRNMLATGARELRVRTPPNTQEAQNRRVEMIYGPSGR